MAGGGGGRDLPETPTWAVAVVCAVIVLISVAMEHGLHKLGHVCKLVLPPLPIDPGHHPSGNSILLLCFLVPGAVVPHAAEEAYVRGAREDQSRCQNQTSN